jgi:hypothetical protein
MCSITPFPVSSSQEIKGREEKTTLFFLPLPEAEKSGVNGQGRLKGVHLDP